MDLELGVAVSAGFALIAVAIFYVFKTGIREKSFEEAIAEQKKRSEDLLGKKEPRRKAAVKDKNKKHKKTKEKEKSHGVDKDDLSDGRSSSHHQEEKHHVEIVAEPEILDEAHLSESRRASVFKDTDKLKPILVNKEEHSPVLQVEEVEPANHFEELHPKDDLELLKRQASSDELSLPRTPPPIPQKSSKKVKKGDVAAVPGDNMDGSGYYENYPVKEVQEDVVEPVNSEVQTSNRPYTPDENQNDGKSGNDKGPTRSKKGKRSEQEREVLTAGKLEAYIEKSPLSSFEIQNLIDILLNKQHVGDSDWQNKNKNDSVSNLKKQLAERERQLSDEQSNSQQLQIKLRDVRQDLTNEKSKAQHTQRQLAEEKAQKEQFFQQLQIRVQQSRQEGNDKQLLQQQLKQLQMSLNNAHEENVALKNALTMEQSGRSKADSLEREAEALRTQCGHLEKQLNAAFQSNQELSNQIRSLQELARAGDELRKQEEMNLHAQMAAQIQERETQFLSELKKTQDMYSEAEHDRTNLRQQISNLQTTMRSSQEAAKAVEELSKKLEDSQKSEMNVKNLLEDSKTELAALKEKLQIRDSKVIEVEQENQRLIEKVAGLSAAQEAAEKEKERLNSDLNSQKIDSSEKELLEQQVAKLQNVLSAVETAKQDLQDQNNALQTELSTLGQDLQAQKGRNEELRSKNIKLLESLNVTEKNLEIQMGKAATAAEDTTQAVESAISEVKSTLLKELPTLSSEMDGTNWATVFAQKVKAELETAKATQQTGTTESREHPDVIALTQETERLKSEVKHYQDVLQSTESLLSNLQNSIEKEEKKWHQKFQIQESELAALKSKTVDVDSEAPQLRKQLASAEDEKVVLGQRCAELDTNIQNLKKQLEESETLRKKINDLERVLKEEVNKNAELNTEKLRLEALVIKEQELKTEDKDKVLRLEAEIASLTRQLSNSSQLVNSSNGVSNGKADGSGDSESLLAKKGDLYTSAATPVSEHVSNDPSSTSVNTPPTSITATSSPETPVSTKETKSKKKKKKKTTIAVIKNESGEDIPAPKTENKTKNGEVYY